jgi:hypothetical protein
MANHRAAEIENSFHIESRPVFNELRHYFCQDDLLGKIF